MAETEWPQTTSQLGAHALRGGLARLHALCACTRPRARVPTCTHARSRTHRPVRNTYCFSTAKNDSRTHLSVRLYVHCPSCFIPVSVFSCNGCGISSGQNLSTKLKDCPLVAMMFRRSSRSTERVDSH